MVRAADQTVLLGMNSSWQSRVIEACHDEQVVVYLRRCACVRRHPGFQALEARILFVSHLDALTLIELKSCILCQQAEGACKCGKRHVQSCESG